MDKILRIFYRCLYRPVGVCLEVSRVRKGDGEARRGPRDLQAEGHPGLAVVVAAPRVQVNVLHAFAAVAEGGQAFVAADN